MVDYGYGSDGGRGRGGGADGDGDSGWVDDVRGCDDGGDAGVDGVV